MPNPFFDHPILNSPYECPLRHWELDEAGQPTQKIVESRRSAKFITPIPKPKKHDPDSYYASRELVPSDMLGYLNTAKIVLTNYHAFKVRERIDLPKGGRQLRQGRDGEELKTQETDGQMFQRVMPDLMGMKNIVIINDEAHHCYREKPKDPDDEDLKGDEKKEAERNNKAAASGFWVSKR
jgi:type III restriction enzyme